MPHDAILSQCYCVVRNPISQQKLREIPFLEISNCHCSYHQRRIIVAHDVIISLQAIIITICTIKGRVIITHDVIISFQHMLMEFVKIEKERETERFV